jgi:hypothetical protein
MSVSKSFHSEISILDDSYEEKNFERDNIASSKLIFMEINKCLTEIEQNNQIEDYEKLKDYEELKEEYEKLKDKYYKLNYELNIKNLKIKRMQHSYNMWEGLIESL